MNQNGARRAIVKLLDDYKSILTNGFVHQGVSRSIDHIFKSVMTAPQTFYYVLVQVDDSLTRSYDRNTREAKPHRSGLYGITIHVTDIATVESDDYEPYEIIDEDFRELCDRIECMLLGTYHAGLGAYGTYFASLPVCIQDPETESKFRLPRGSSDRQVRVINLDHTWEDPNTDQYVPLLYSQIKFQLEEEWER